jgi:peptidoglycan-associated lipoprotein
MSRQFLMAIPIAVLVVGGSTACATKKLVRTSVGEVNEKVDSVGRSVEVTQERTRQNEGKIAEVDEKVLAVDQKAQAADQKAQAAAQSAQQANAAAGQAASAASAAGSKADAVDKAAKRIVFEVVMNEDQGDFKFGKTALPDAAKGRLDDLIAQMKADPKGAYFEIEGHTDNTGDTLANEHLGMERADAVKRYLYEHHQVPLHKINVISYGEAKPVATNATKAGRAQNRRVVIRVLS